MRTTALRAALVAAMLAPLAALAQYSQPGSSGARPDSSAAPTTTPQHGLEGARSKHCDTMTGAQKDQCLKDEAAKTDSKAPSEGAASGASAAAGAKSAGDTVSPSDSEKKATEEAD